MLADDGVTVSTAAGTLVLSGTNLLTTGIAFAEMRQAYLTRLRLVEILTDQVRLQKYLPQATLALDSNKRYDPYADAYC